MSPAGHAAQRRGTLTEVAPRDGFQPIGPFIPISEKAACALAAHHGRSGRKKARISSARRSGCSMAAKCPPCSITLQRRMSV